MRFGCIYHTHKKEDKTLLHSFPHIIKRREIPTLHTHTHGFTANALQFAGLINDRGEHDESMAISYTDPSACPAAKSTSSCPMFINKTYRVRIAR